MKCKYGLLVVGIVAWSCDAICGMPPEEMLQRAMELPQRIETWKLEYNRPTSPITSDDLRKTLISGDSWCFTLGKPGPDFPKIIEGFDGEVYHVKRGDDEKIGVYGSSEILQNANGELHPLVTPYYWFFETATAAKWADLKSPSNWAEINSRMQFEQVRKVDDDSLDEFRLNRGDREFVIGFSNKYSGFHRSVQQFRNGELFSELYVSQIRSSSDGAFIGVAFDASSPNNESVRTMTVDANSIQVNQAIDPSEFQFDPRNTYRTIDADKLPKKSFDEETPDTQNGFNLFAAIIVIGLIIIIAIFLRRRIKGN